MPTPYMNGYIPATGQPNGSGTLSEMSIYSPTPFWTAGGMISNLEDLKTWSYALATGKLLSKSMHAEQIKATPPNTPNYGLGISQSAWSIVLINRYPSTIEGAADQINFALISTMVAK